jgi:hypothetical protein
MQFYCQEVRERNLGDQRICVRWEKIGGEKCKKKNNKKRRKVSSTINSRLLTPLNSKLTLKKDTTADNKKSKEYIFYTFRKKNSILPFWIFAPEIQNCGIIQLKNIPPLAEHHAAVSYFHQPTAAAGGDSRRRFSDAKIRYRKRTPT